MPATPPYTVITSTDRSGQLLSVAIAALALAVVSVGLRIFVSNQLRSTVAFYRDDVLCFIAAIFFAVQVALVWVGIVQGNGKTIDLISSQNVDRLQRTQYAVDIVYITVLFFSRASVISLLERLQGIGFKPVWIWSFTVLTLWFIACIFATSLKCDLSRPWIQYNVQCTGLLSRWQAIEILGIITECSIFALAGRLVHIGRMSTNAKVKILCLFATRILVIVFAALRVSSLSDYFHSTSPTLTGITAAIYALAEANASVITATTPLLKSFVLRFKYSDIAPIDNKPLLTFNITGKNDQETPPESREASNVSEHEKPTSGSSLGEEA